jgi:hypothetical protein
MTLDRQDHYSSLAESSFNTSIGCVIDGKTHTLTLTLILSSVFLYVTMVNLVGFVFTYMAWLTGRNAQQVPPKRKENVTERFFTLVDYNLWSP